MTNRIFIILSLLTFSPLFSYSNGGPVDISHFRKTGNIRLLRKADVSLLKENLNIKVIGDYTEIQVEYHLKNNGKQQKIQYGFPIDAYETNWHYGDSYPVFDKHNDFVDYFKILENEHELKISYWVVDSFYKAQSVDLNEGFYRSEDTSVILRKWYSTTIDFKQEEIKVIKVFYKVKNTMRDKVPGFCYVNRYTDRHFTYHLTPSSNWGNGIVDEFNLNIDLTDISAVGADFIISGIDSLTNINNQFIYSTKNFDLNRSERINIHYNNSFIKLSEFIKEKELPKNIIKSIRSSSNSSTINNLIDDSFQTTWTGKQGDWIEIEFNKIHRKKGKGIIYPAGILVLNGDYSNKEKFIKSGKLKIITVIINDSIIYNSEPWEDEQGKKIIHLDKPFFKNINTKYIAGLATIIAEGDGLVLWNYRNYRLCKIRIQIQAVDGNAGSDVTLSELYILGE